MVYLYSGSVTSEIASVCSLVAELVEKLRPQLSPSNLFDLRLILSELMINGCEHGNANDRRKAVYLDLEVLDDRIEVKVCDEGRGFRYDSDAFDPTKLSCSGRGLKIVHGLCDEMKVRDSEVTCVLYREDSKKAVH